MKILLFGPASHPHPQGVCRALNKLGHQAVLISWRPFYENCSYWQRKLYKFGYNKQKENFEGSQKEACLAAYNRLQPDLVLILTGIPNEFFDMFAAFKCKKALWLWDGLTRYPDMEKPISMVSSVFCFEYEDVAYVSKKYNLNAHFCPLGYDEDIFTKKYIKQDIDISFVGMPSPRRLEILDVAAKYAHDNQLNMVVAGKWYDKNHFWKKIQFKKKHPYLYTYIINNWISAEEAAALYQRSKICLNITQKEHLSQNPRTFEILATGAFQISDRVYPVGDVRSIVSHGLEQADDKDSFLMKIDYYLQHDEERKNMAVASYEEVIHSASMRKLLEKRILPYV